MPTTEVETTNYKLNYERADWDRLNKAIAAELFNPYCFSNVDELVNQWYNWFWKLIERFIPRVTQHRAALPPWYSSYTSNIVKRFNTMKRAKKHKSLENTKKIKKLEKLIKSRAKDDLKDYETTVFEVRTFSKIQKNTSISKNLQTFLNL